MDCFKATKYRRVRFEDVDFLNKQPGINVEIEACAVY